MVPTHPGVFSAHIHVKKNSFWRHSHSLTALYRILFLSMISGTELHVFRAAGGKLCNGGRLVCVFRRDD